MGMGNGEKGGKSEVVLPYSAEGSDKVLAFLPAAILFFSPGFSF
jgi:hypothetical protein